MQQWLICSMTQTYSVKIKHFDKKRQFIPVKLVTDKQTSTNMRESDSKFTLVNLS